VAAVKLAKPVFIASPAPARGRDFRIYVVFTDLAGTRAALTAASRLAAGLEMPLALLVAQIVPYPLPLETPPVSVEFIERNMSELVRGLDVEVSVHVLLCRDPGGPLRDAIEPDSLVVMGASRGRWKSRHRKLAALLRTEGRRLVLID
jgi:hypothetical protein